MQLSSQEAQNLIENELIQMGVQPQTMVNSDQLLNLLDNKIGGRTFDRGVAIQLIDQIEKDQAGRFSLGDFVHIVVEARAILIEKDAETVGNIDNFERQKEETWQQLQVHQRDERLNEYGIMTDSILIVHELEVGDLHNANNYELFLRVNCEGNTFQSGLQVYRQGARWEEQFKIEIKTGQDDVQFILYLHESDDVEPHVLGGVGIPIERLNDQQRHAEWFDIFDQNGNVSGGRMHVSLHWIHSRVKYLGSLIEGWDEHINMLMEDRKDYQRDLEILYDLFPSLRGGQPAKLFSFQNKDPEQRNVVPNSYASVDDRPFGPLEHEQKAGPHAIHIEQPKPVVKEVVRETPKEVIKETSHHIPMEDLYDTKINWENNSLSGLIAFYTSIALVILGLFGCLLKAAFFDITLGLGFLCLFDLKRRFSGGVKIVSVFAAATVVALVIEIFWFSTFAFRWGHHHGDADLSQDEFRFNFVIRIFSFIVKLILVVCHIMFYRFLLRYRGQENTSLTRAQY